MTETLAQAARLTLAHAVSAAICDFGDCFAKAAAAMLNVKRPLGIIGLVAAVGIALGVLARDDPKVQMGRCDKEAIGFFPGPFMAELPNSVHERRGV